MQELTMQEIDFVSGATDAEFWAGVGLGVGVVLVVAAVIMLM